MAAVAQAYRRRWIPESPNDADVAVEVDVAHLSTDSAAAVQAAAVARARQRADARGKTVRVDGSTLLSSSGSNRVTTVRMTVPD